MISQNLAVAKRRKALINVYQKHSEVFYTGLVNHLSTDGVVIRTFNEYGMADGMVFVKQSEIRRLEFMSQDLKNMRIRIQIAHLNGLLEYTTEKPMKLVGDHEIVKQILGRSYVEKQVVMLELVSEVHYLEGLVTKVGQQGFVFDVIDKFNFSNHQQMEIPYSNVRVIEFQGKELSLLSQTQSILHGPSINPLIQSLPLAIKKGLFQAKQSHRMVEVEAIQDQNYFYVGWVVAINGRNVIFKVIDMAGQFGGYVLMRLNSIRYLTEHSDYLKLIQRCVQINRREKNLVQPVLNADRAFDPTEDLVEMVLRQALVMHRLVRIRLLGTRNSEMGQPSQVRTNSLVFRPVSNGQNQLSSGQVIGFSSLQEIAFDYLGTYLAQKQLEIQHWRR